MEVAKLLAGGLAVNRAAFGLGYPLRPGRARGSWIGRAADQPGTQVMICSQGVRDITLGAVRYAPCSAVTRRSCAPGWPATRCAT
jgi:hypothetical protein